jgi:DNA-binding NarL/FixJ family response regulator
MSNGYVPLNEGVPNFPGQRCIAKEETLAQGIILADNQMIFRTGVARVLSLEPDLQIIAQCADLNRLKEAVFAFRRTIVLFPSSISSDLHEVMNWIEEAGSQAIVILEHGAELDESIAQRAEGVLLRSVAAAQLVDTLHRVAAGERVVQRSSVKSAPSQDRVGARVLAGLTPKEVQIIALVAEGFKNKEIASRLATKEQVVKNYLRGIYDKTGVSDRLELALFTIHHRTLAVAASSALASLAKSA